MEMRLSTYACLRMSKPSHVYVRARSVFCYFCTPINDGSCAPVGVSMHSTVVRLFSTRTRLSSHLRRL